MARVKYEIKTEALKSKCKKCFNKLCAAFGADMFRSLTGFRESPDFDGIAAYFTDDGLGYPAGYVVVKDNTVTEWVIIHELAHALENSAFGDRFEAGSGQVLDKLGEKPKRKSDYEMAECLADFIADNIDGAKIMEVRKCLNEAI